MPSAERALAPQAGVPLAPLSTLGVGGPARWFVRAPTADAVAAAHQWCADHRVPLLVLGGGSNLVIADAGVNALVMQVAIRGADLSTLGGGAILRAGAGAPWDDVVALAVSRGLGGLECLSGIPGSVGGTPIQNVGAYGQDVAGALQDVAVFDRETARMETLQASECRFGYRTSRFKQDDAGRFVVCGVTFLLREAAATVSYPDVIRHLEQLGIASPGVGDVRNAVLAIRRRKGMVIDAADPDTRSVGSFFMNPVVPADAHTTIGSLTAGPVPAFELPAGQVKIPAAWLIERAGFARGFRLGRAGISSKHPLAIVNLGGATARDVLALASRIKRTVADRFGIRLRPEPVFIGFEDDPDVEFLHTR